MHELTSKFKNRMHIFHSSEDESIDNILTNCEKAINEITGEKNEELIIERARYVYNDSLEFFNDNFLDLLLSKSIENYEDGDTNE